MKSQTLRVKLKNNPYDILLSADTAEFVSRLKKIADVRAPLFVITDSNVAKLHLDSFLNALKKAGFACRVAVIKAGETGKSLQTLCRLYDKALDQGMDRKSCAVAFGGGVVGDAAGFFASTYMRGIRYVQVPTTLLAMTDSSVGGKTAVNTSGGKNIAGAFCQPSLVWINPDYLATLPERQIKNGLAEVVKYAFTFDAKFHDYISDMFESGIISSEDFEYMILKSCGYKASVVEKDEKETKGLREVLNFGHTLAHAIETYTEYKKFLHGEAVAAGMLFAAQLSARVKMCGMDTYFEVKNLLESAGLLLKLGTLNADKLLALMKKDKKSVGGDIRFVLLKNVGKAITGVRVPDKIVRETLIKFLNS
ncbi:MAG: 3-dehydroquinate synthase [Endomicrobia bacterium]|nr:3-dehydroquinate synthase [Endomicrobiia bacterium]